MATTENPNLSMRPPRQCVACGAADARPLFRGLVRCTTCGMVYFPQRCSRTEIEQLYSEDYFHGAEYFDYLADRAAHEANFRARLRVLKRWVPGGKRVFEIGCAYGFFLNLARNFWQVRGCDIAGLPCQHARDRLGLDVVRADFTEVDLGAGAVDAFCLWDAIEHLEDPGDYLARMATALPIGGIVALTTGDIDSWLARLQGPRWRQIHPPTHIWYFSPATLRRTLERFGFEVLWSRHVGMWRSLGQITHSLTSLGRTEPSRLHRFCMRTGLGSRSLWLNTFDLLMVVARRLPASAVPAVRRAA
jgi:SAM-dependent methyltransferase